MVYTTSLKMDVLSPDLLWIDDRCYRIPILDNFSLKGVSENLDEDRWVSADSKFEIYESNEDDNIDDSDIWDFQRLPDDRYQLSIPVPQIFWSKIIGSKGVTKKRIESNTKTIIIIPKAMEHGSVVIKGNSKKDIILAKKNIDAIVSSSRQKLVCTHFISIPMNSDEIKVNFQIFKDQVLQLYGTERGVDESIFQNPDKLHITIGLLVLTDQNEREIAEKSLTEVCEKTVKPLLKNIKNCMIEMKGIEYMNDDPKEVDVLYGKVGIKTEPGLLQKIVNDISEYFSHNYLYRTSESQQVKLHVTLMNTLLREEEHEEVNEEIAQNLRRNKLNKKPRRTFNAANILKEFKDFYFGQQELKTIQLSVRFSTDKVGYYKSSCVINL